MHCYHKYSESLFMIAEICEKSKLNESERQKLGSQKPCQQEQHAKLYYDLLQAQKQGTFDSPELPSGKRLFSKIN